MGDERMQRLSPLENFTVGVTAGVIDVSLTQWILYCKNATQQNVKIELKLSTLYRGYSMSCINMAVLSGLQFPLTGIVTSAITGGKERRLTDTEQVGAGFLGGVISGFVCAPMELVMIQQQRFGTALLATPAKIVAETGPTGLMRGLMMSCGREGLFTAGMLGLGPSITRYAQEEWGYSKYKAATLGAVGGGVLVATLSHPMDTIKTCMQGDIQQKTYGGVVHTAKTLMTQSGFRRFFNGWSWRTGRLVLEVFIFGEAKERLSPLMFPHHFRD